MPQLQFPHISCRHYRDQQTDCGGKERGGGLLRPRTPAGVSTWGGRRARLSHVHQTDAKSERSQIDSQAPMGNATTRSIERMAAAMGAPGSHSVPIEFHTHCDELLYGAAKSHRPVAALERLRELILWRRVARPTRAPSNSMSVIPPSGTEPLKLASLFEVPGAAPELAQI